MSSSTSTTTTTTTTTTIVSDVGARTSCPLFFTLPNELRAQIYEGVFSSFSSSSSSSSSSDTPVRRLHLPSAGSPTSHHHHDRSERGLPSSRSWDHPPPAAAAAAPTRQHDNPLLRLQLVCRAFLNDQTLYDEFFRNARFVVSSVTDLQPPLCGRYCPIHHHARLRRGRDRDRDRGPATAPRSHGGRNNDVVQQISRHHHHHHHHCPADLIRHVCVRAGSAAQRPPPHPFHPGAMYNKVPDETLPHHDLTVSLITKFLPNLQSLTIEQSGAHINTFQYEYEFSLDDLRMSGDHTGDRDHERDRLGARAHPPGPPHSPSSTCPGDGNVVLQNLFDRRFGSTLADCLMTTADKFGARWYRTLLRDALAHDIRLEFKLELLFEKEMDVLQSRGLGEVYDICDAHVTSRDWILRIDEDGGGDGGDAGCESGGGSGNGSRNRRRRRRQWEFMQRTGTDQSGTAAWIAWLDTR